MESNTSLIRQPPFFISHLETKETAEKSGSWNQQFRVITPHRKALKIHIFFNHSEPINSYFRRNIYVFISQVVAQDR